MNDIIEVDRPLAPQQTAIAEQSPMGMMLSAMSQGASLEQIEKMMALQERWEAGEARKAYNTVPGCVASLLRRDFLSGYWVPLAHG